MIASSDDSTIAETCASLARACSSAEMSVSVSTTPSGDSERSAGTPNGPSVLSLIRARYGRMRRNRQRWRLSQVWASTVTPSCRTRSMSAINVGCARSCANVRSGRPTSCGMTRKVSAIRGVNFRMQSCRSRNIVATSVPFSRCSMSLFSSWSSTFFFWYSALTVYISSLTEWSSSFVLWSSSLAATSSSLVACSSSFAVSCSWTSACRCSLT